MDWRLEEDTDTLKIYEGEKFIAWFLWDGSQLLLDNLTELVKEHNKLVLKLELVNATIRNVF